MTVWNHDLKETDTKLGPTVILLTRRLTDADSVEIKLANGKTECFSTDDDVPQKIVKLKVKYRGYRGSKNRQVLVIENRE